MTAIDIEKGQPVSEEITEGETAIANNCDGRKLSERVASTDARQAGKPSDDDLFDKMPI